MAVNTIRLVGERRELLLNSLRLKETRKARHTYLALASAESAAAAFLLAVAVEGILRRDYNYALALVPGGSVVAFMADAINGVISTSQDIAEAKNAARK